MPFFCGWLLGSTGCRWLCFAELPPLLEGRLLLLVGLHLLLMLLVVMLLLLLAELLLLTSSCR